MIVKWREKRYVTSVIQIFFAILLASLLIFGYGKETVLLNSLNDYDTDNFGIEGTYPVNPTSLDSVKSKYEDILLWGSWVGNDGNRGKLVSNKFIAPDILSFFVAGYPLKQGNKVFIEQINTGKKLEFLNISNPGEKWEQIIYILPSSWKGSEIKLVAIDNTTQEAGWLGISSPIIVNWRTLFFSNLSTLFIIPVYLIHFIFFVLSGLSFIFVSGLHRKFSTWHQVILGIGVSSLFSYALFWIYLLNHYIGVSSSILMLIGSSLVIFKSLQSKKFISSFILSPDIIIPTLIMFLTGLIYLFALYITNLNGNPDEIIWNRFLEWLPPDNIIPRIFAEKLYVGKDPRLLLGDWLSSDRPPLQTAIVLVQRPLMIWGNPHLFSLQYQVLSTIIQCSWIPAIWSLCRSVGFSLRQIITILVFAIFSGFFLLNSLFVWPKLISGSFIVFVIALAIQAFRDSRAISISRFIAAATATSLGLLGHGGVVFTLIPVFIIVFLNKKRLSIVKIITAITIIALLMMPWTAYQNLYDPPGNRLVKWHIGGVIDIDSRSSLETIIDSYRSITVGKFFANKISNAQFLIGPLPSRKYSVESRRSYEFYHYLHALGVVNCGWLILVVSCLFKNLRAGTWKLYREIIIIILLSLCSWVLIMFGPSATSIHQGSYATMMLLFILLGSAIANLPIFWVYLIMTIHIVNFFEVWILTTPYYSQDSLLLLPNIVAMVSFALFSVILLKLFFNISKNAKINLDKSFN